MEIFYSLLVSKIKTTSERDDQSRGAAVVKRRRLLNLPGAGSWSVERVYAIAFPRPASFRAGVRSRL